MRSWSNFVKASGVITLVALLVLVGIGGTGAQAGAILQATGSPTMGTTTEPTVAATGGATTEATLPVTTVATVGATVIVPTTAAGAAGGGAATTAATAAGTQAAQPFTGCPPAIVTGMINATQAATVSGTESAMATSVSTAAVAEATVSATTAPASGTQQAGTTTMPAVFGQGGCLFSAVLAGPNEVPQAGPASAMGSAVVGIDTTLGQVCFDIQVMGLNLPATAAHIHRGAAGVPGPVVVPLTAPDASGHSAGCIDNIDKALLGEILANPANFYVNVHNKDLPNGAARGQLGGGVKMTGKVEVPEGSPTGFGVASFAADTTSNQICYQIFVGGITLPAKAAHIHKAAAGVAGPVVVPLTAPDAIGVASGCVSADQAVIADILANPGNYYVNVHTTEFPNGALRGQLDGR